MDEEFERKKLINRIKFLDKKILGLEKRKDSLVLKRKSIEEQLFFIFSDSERIYRNKILQGIFNSININHNNSDDNFKIDFLWIEAFLSIVKKVLEGHNNIKIHSIQSHFEKLLILRYEKIKIENK
ncbi:MAG: hypothetical protein GKR88_13000 [Flavobacteriaceae bacterium]|nr:MAG: hypothetical protein GKR88_13000 [Flavobacteriaceae bacterium]